MAALAAVPVLAGLAAARADRHSALADLRSTPPPDHAMRGVVESVGTTTLVIARPRKVPREMTFTLSPSTAREGTIGAGATVQVRFRSIGGTHVATAVVAVPPRPGERHDAAGSTPRAAHPGDADPHGREW